MPDTPERWIDIKGYEGCYQVSDKGRIKSLGRNVIRNGVTYFQAEHIMCPWCGTTSLYDRVRLFRNGTGKKFSIHRLVAQYFLPTWNERLEVNHIDGNRYNNDVSNLEMCTRQENVLHAIIHFLKNDYGEKSSNAKLTNAQAEEIRRLYYAGNTTQNALAGQFNVCSRTINAIVHFKRYYR